MAKWSSRAPSIGVGQPSVPGINGESDELPVICSTASTTQRMISAVASQYAKSSTDPPASAKPIINSLWVFGYI